MTATRASAPQEPAVQPSAIGFRILRLKAEMSSQPLTANRHPLTAYLKIPSSQGLRTGITFAGGDDVAVKFRGELETR